MFLHCFCGIDGGGEALPDSFEQKGGTNLDSTIRKDTSKTNLMDKSRPRNKEGIRGKAQMSQGNRMTR